LSEKHVVKQGECFISIAASKGFSWQTLWNDIGNKALKDLRKDPHVILPGDEILIPEKKLREETGNTDQRHTFQRIGLPPKMRIVLLDDNQDPRVDLPYILEVDGETFSGTTDGGGVVEHRISPRASTGNLRVGPEYVERYTLRLGHLDPHDEVVGVQKRLKNLGYECGEFDGEAGPKTKAALRAFQKRCGIEETGIIDETTRQKLRQLHQS